MIALYVIGGILVFFLLLLCVKVTVNISFINDLQVKLKIFFIRIKIYPFEEKEEKIVPQKEKKKQKAIKKQKVARPKPPLKETLLLLKELILKILAKFGKYIKIEEYRIKVLIATNNPAKTGILYGVACGILGSVSVLIDRIKRRTHREGKILTEVIPDFIAEEPELYVSVSLSIRVWQLFSMGITASKGLLKYNSLSKKEGKADEQRNAAKTNN